MEIMVFWIRYNLRQLEIEAIYLKGGWEWNLTVMNSVTRVALLTIGLGRELGTIIWIGALDVNYELYNVTYLIQVESGINNM